MARGSLKMNSIDIDVSRHCRRWIGRAIILASVLSVLHQGTYAQQSDEPIWIGSWSTAPMTPSLDEQRDFCNVTLREIAHLSIGGSRIRVRLTNEFGSTPLIVSGVHLALSSGGSRIQPGTDRALTFNGEPMVRIPAGSIELSDPVDLNVPPLSDVAVSIYLPSQYIRDATYHDEAEQVNYLVVGNTVASTDFAAASELESWYFLDGIDVVAGDNKARAIVVLGESITDGAYSGVNQNRRWTDVLARRLQTEKGTADLGVLNEGIGGNRILNDGSGPNALSRFDRDVLSQSGAGFLIILAGSNDIGHLIKHPVAEINAEQLEGALVQMIDRAHAAGIKVLGATMLPFEGAGYYSEKGEEIRETVNQWIRTRGKFDGVIDFDKIMQDPEKPKRILPQYDHGDHLHPNDLGYKAMGDAVNLKLFGERDSIHATKN